MSAVSSYLKFLFICALIFFTSPSYAEMNQKEEAAVCIDKITADRKKGGSLAELINKYIDVRQLTARSVMVQGYGPWSKLSKEAQNGFKFKVQNYIEQEKGKAAKQTSNRDDVNPDTIVVNRNRIRPIGKSLEVTGSYKTMGGESVNFGAIVIPNNCRVIDVRWKDAWLSRFVPLE